MPTDPFLPEGQNFPRPRSPDTGSGYERKRRRKVLSCYDCRRRKLQCDRVMPACGRCTKAGQAANCLYIDDATDVPPKEAEADLTPRSNNSIPYYAQNKSLPGKAGLSQGDTLLRLEYQDNRIKQLEAALAQANSGGASQRRQGSRVPPTPDSVMINVDSNAVTDERETVRLRGKSFKTQFQGNSHPGALIAYVPELHSFTRETFEHFPALQRIREDMRALECRAKDELEEIRAENDDALRALLPTKQDADQLIRLYLDNYGSLYHVLHLPSFWKDYNEIFEDVQKSNAHSVALVLLMMAAAQCLTTSQPWVYRANSSAARNKAIRAIEAVDNWLLAQSQKHVTAADFQIRIIAAIAKQVAARKFKRTWTDLGGTLRFCMAAGLHRSPDLIRKPTSILDKELRRRVWAAVTELELQAAFDRGMVSAPWALQADCPPPSLIDDDDIDQLTAQMPHTRKVNDFCNVSFLTVASDSMLLRATLNNHLNNIRHVMTFEEAKRYTDEIQTALSELPDWIGSTPETPRALLALTLRQYLLVLHDRQIRLAETKSEVDYSRMILLETASKIIETHKSLTSRGCYALELLCCDQLRAALSLCHITASLDPRADDALSMIIKQTGPRLVEESIQMLCDKVVRFGREQRQLWIVVAANGYMRTRDNPSKRLEFMQEAVDAITKPYYKILAGQDEPPARALLGNAPPSETPKGILEYYNPNLGQHPEASGNLPNSDQVSDPALLNMDDIVAWTLADWSYDPFPGELPSFSDETTTEQPM